MTDPASILNHGRMLSDGVPYFDIDRAARLAWEDPEFDWYEHWTELSHAYEQRAEAAIGRGDTISGGRWMWNASLSSHYAQFMWFHDPDRREAGQRRKVELYNRAAPHLLPAAERVEVAIDDSRIPGFLRLPAAGGGPFPCCVLIGGLESTKEESHLFEDLCLERGLATFSFDGPGQGELFFDVKLVGDFERYTSAVVDELERREEIDGGRIGVLGRSLGGHYAPRSAAGDDRLKACCAWGACFDLSGLDEMPAHTRAGFIYVTGIEDEQRAGVRLRESIDLAELAPALRCPTLVTHGRHDTIFGLDQVEKFREHVTNAPLEIEVDDDGDHCCHNRGHLVRPRMADWMAAQLGSQR
jgi:2,6-dihydroxypseudooxynicotine hydrolase